MKLYRLLLLLLIPTLITLVSCGSDSDDSDDSSSEEETTTTTTTGTTTGGTTTGDDGNTCMTSSQRTNIRNMFDRAAGQSPYNGRATEITRNEDGTFTTLLYPDSVVTVTKTTTDTWRTTASYCDGDMCVERDTIHSVAGTCYTSDTRQARITSSSSSSLSTRINDNTANPPIVERTVIRVPSTGTASFSTSITRNGLRVNLTTFVEESSGGSTTTGTTTTGDTGATATTGL